MRAKLKGHAFLSYSHADETRAQAIQSLLEEVGIRTYTYKSRLPFGGNLDQQVAAAVESSDYFLVLLSDNARQSDWVSRELGLALELQQKGDGKRPLIVGVYSDAPCTSLEFRVCDYWTRAISARPVFDFGVVRNLDTRGAQATTELSLFAKLLLPQVIEIDLDSDEHLRLLRESFDVYEECFPDDAECDPPEAIEEWLVMAHRAKSMDLKSPWREIYAVLSVSGVPIGMTFLTVHLNRRWAFGNYFCVRRGWRQLDRVSGFMERLAELLLETSPSLRGVVFEIDPLDEEPFNDAGQAPQLASLPEGSKQPLFASLRAARRLTWYASYYAQALMGADGKPLPYWQPSMEETKDPCNERLLIPMVMKLNEATITPEDIRDIIDFVYDDLYRDAYGSEGSMTIDDYPAYVADVKARVVANLAGAYAAPLRLGGRAQKLIRRARKENLFDFLNL